MTKTKLPSLIFQIAPHAIQDLGSNLYTSFPKVLAEFVANAYDADATDVRINFDFKKSEDLRRAMRTTYARELAAVGDPAKVTPLADRFLPDTVSIEIRDNGFGMNEEELNERFLWTARKRRTLCDLTRTKSRPLMGRKGLGKLAGFGVARLLEVVTKKEGEKAAIRFTLDYDNILKEESLAKISISSDWDTDTFSTDEFGTIIYLKRLGYDAVKSRPQTIVRDLSEHFAYVDSKDFKIRINEHTVPPPNYQFAYAWPDPDLPKLSLVEHQLETDVGTVKFAWRIRFRKDKKALPAAKRGVRVYAHNRLAAPPSLFDADTNMHGFRMTDYMDGVVTADFLDDQEQDYIATNRQSLKWDTPLLSPLKDFISKQITEACKKYQKVRDVAKEEEVILDPFTADLIDANAFSKREQSLVRSVAVRLARFCKQGIEDSMYREVLPQIARAVGSGTMYETLTSLALMDKPDLNALIVEVVRLNKLELDGSTSIVRSKIKAIETLKKEIRKSPKRGEPRNEKVIQKLFEEAPWLIAPNYTDYLTADKSLNTTLKNLADRLELTETDVPNSVKGSLRREADFVFVLGDEPLQTVVIIELKATTIEATVTDVLQLREYMDVARKWLKKNAPGNVRVFGELICTPPDVESKDKLHRQFWIETEKLTPDSDHRVRPYLVVLKDTEQSHANILEVAKHLIDDGWSS